jgi:hypothetical protein
MDQRDRELLDKQLRRLHLSPRSDGAMVVAFLAMALGGFLFAYNNNSEPMQIASIDATPQIFLPNGAPPTTPH